VLVLDSGAVSRLAERSRRAAALILALREEGLWPPVVPSVVLVECLQGRAGRDAPANRFLKTCDVAEEIGGIAFTSDGDDLQAPAGHATRVSVERV
jgi:hypothetical protein